MKKKRAKKFSLRREYKESWNYIKESRFFIYAVVVIFFLFVLAGFFIPLPEKFSVMILEYIQKILEQTKDLSFFGMIKFIFFNNLQSCFFGMLFGVVLGIFPVFSAIGNGFFVGFVSALSVQSDGIFSLWRLLPHGIFELPAVFIALGLGLKLGSFIFHKNKINVLKEYFFKSLKVFLFVVVPLLIIAGIIEGVLIFLMA